MKRVYNWGDGGRRVDWGDLDSDRSPRVHSSQESANDANGLVSVQISAGVGVAEIRRRARADDVGRLNIMDGKSRPLVGQRHFEFKD